MRKYSKQREVILKAVTEDLYHPTVDEIYLLSKKDNPKISLGTVYRNLNLLAEMGKISKISMPDGSDRFDGDIKPHHHLCCTNCGKVIDYCSRELENLPTQILQDTEFEVQSINLVVKGICKDCR